MIVITGGAGFIGSCLAWKFNALGRSDLLIVDDHGAVPPINDTVKDYVLNYLEKSDPYL